MTGQRLLHVAIADDWEACQRFGEYDVSTRGMSVDDTGFVHAATEPQLATVLRDVYGDLSLPLLVVVIDEDALAAAGVDIRWEAPSTRGSERVVPRIMGVLPMNSATIVVEIPLDRRGDGWVVPELSGYSVRSTPPATA